jgi:hypothetical protein
MKLFSAMRVFGTASRGRTVADSSEFCVHHTRLLETVDAGRAEAGRTPKRREGNQPILCVVPEPAVGPETAAAAATLTRADPATVGPSLATAAAENVEQLTASLLEAAGSAVKPVWLTVECAGCGERSRVEAPVPDVRARVAAIEVLLREGLGRAPQAEESAAPRVPTTVASVREMGWEELQLLASTIVADEIVAVVRGGGRELLRERLARLSDEERRVVREELVATAKGSGATVALSETFEPHLGGVTEFRCV